MAKKKTTPSANVSKKTSAGQDKTVQAYIDKLDGWRAEAVAKLDQLVTAAAPKCVSGIKWAQPVYEQGGPFAYIKAHKNHVNFGFLWGVDLPDPQGLLEGTGDKMRHVKITSTSDIQPAALKALVKAAVKLNQTHGDPTKVSREKQTGEEKVTFAKQTRLLVAQLYRSLQCLSRITSFM